MFYYYKVKIYFSCLNKLINTINSDFLYDSGENFTANIFYDNDKFYVKKMNEGLNIIKIKRIQNIPKKEYLKVFTNNLF